jgi:putative membrane protein
VSRSPLLPLVLLAGAAAALAASAWQPADRATWWMEVAPVFIVAPILVGSYPRFRLTDLLYSLIFVHALILMVGGHYTYAKVPLGFWMEDWFGFTRNHYDRIGHFVQGFVPALAAREVLLRRGVLKRGGWLVFVVLSICLAVSALYELIEWQAAVLGGSAADAFLGTQGDVWDTQEDMATCLFGAAAALLLLPRWHDRQLAALEARA